MITIQDFRDGEGRRIFVWHGGLRTVYYLEGETMEQAFFNCYWDYTDHRGMTVLLPTEFM